VVVQSGAKLDKVTQIGHALIAGDRVQTKAGEAQVTFTDGALMKIRHNFWLV
jgi:hypothetical protein